MPDGAYKISAQAMNGGTASAATPLSLGMVNAITPSPTGATLEVSKLGTFDMTKILMVM